MRGKYIEKPKEFIVMNSRLEYFCGMMYGGQLVWSPDYRDAKYLNDEAKFEGLRGLCMGEELAMDYVN